MTTAKTKGTKDAPRSIEQASSDNVERPPAIEQIEKRAYQLFEQRGCTPGAALEDWLQAEQELGLKSSSS